MEKEKLDIERFWEEMSIEDRTKILQKNNCWTGVSTYFWQYIPNQIKTVIEEELEKSRR